MLFTSSHHPKLFFIFIFLSLVDILETLSFLKYKLPNLNDPIGVFLSPSFLLVVDPFLPIQQINLNNTALKSKELSNALIIGGGHNGLTAAAYLGRAGKKVLVLERRHVLGGAAVTEEVFPGFKFSVCSYVVSLMKSNVICLLYTSPSPRDS